MKLHSPAFERRLRRKVRQAIRGSPELKREARRTNRARHYSGGWFLRLLLSGLAAGLALSIAAKTGHPTTALVFAGIWLLAWLSFQIQMLGNQLYASTDLSAFLLLPIETRVVFRRQIEKFLRGAGWLIVDLLAMLGALAVWAEIPAANWAAILPVAALAWLTTLALVGLAIVHCTWLPYPLVSAAVMLAGFVLLVAGSYVGPPLLTALDENASTLRLLLPTVWPLSLFQCLRPNASWPEALFLVPSLGLIWTLRHTLSRLAAGYEFAEPLQAEAADVLPVNLASELASPKDQPARVGLTTIEEFVQTRGFLAAASWPKADWLEGWLWRWFSARERKVAEFAFPQEVRITGPWKKVFLHLGIGVAIGLALSWVSPVFQLWTWSAVMLLTALRAVACFYANGRAFSPMFCSGVNIQLHAAYPIGYRELSWVLFKYSFVQLPLLAGFLIACGLLLAHLATWKIADGAMIGFKLAVLLAAGRFIFVALTFSAGTNDSTRLRVSTFVLVAAVLAVGAVFLGLGVGAVLVPNAALATGLWLGAVLDAWLFWRIYGWFYDVNRFDVMNLPKQHI